MSEVEEEKIPTSITQEEEMESMAAIFAIADDFTLTSVKSPFHTRYIYESMSLIMIHQIHQLEEDFQMI